MDDMLMMVQMSRNANINEQWEKCSNGWGFGEGTP